MGVAVDDGFFTVQEFWQHLPIVHRRRGGGQGSAALYALVLVNAMVELFDTVSISGNARKDEEAW
jgi:hypothetical protein